MTKVAEYGNEAFVAADETKDSLEYALYWCKALIESDEELERTVLYMRGMRIVVSLQ